MYNSLSSRIALMKFVDAALFLTRVARLSVEMGELCESG